MSLAGSAARGAATTLAGQGLRFVLQLVSVSVLARLLSPDDYGVFSMVVSVVGVASILGDFGLSMASIQSQTLTNTQRSNLFWTNAAIGALLTVAVYFVSGPIADFYSRPELIPVTQASAITFMLNALTPQFRAEITSQLRFRWLAAADVSAQAAGLLAAIWFALNGAGYWALVLQQIGIALVTLGVTVAGAKWLPGLPRRRAQMGALYRYGLHTLGVQVITYVTSNVDNVLVGRFSGAAALGTYSRAYQIFRLPLQQIAAPMTRVAFPVLSKMQNDAKYDGYVQRAQVILTYTFGGVFFVLAAVSGPAIEILLGPQWDAAKPIFAVLAIGGVFQALGYVYYWIYLSRAYTGLQLKYSVIGRAIMVAMMAVGVIWGPLGVAVGSSLGQVTMWLLNTIFGIPKTGVRTTTLVGLAIRPLALFTLMVGATLPVSLFVTNDLGAWIQLLILTGVMFAYLGSAFLFVPPIRRDILLIWDAARRVRQL